MTLCPASREDLARALRSASERGNRIEAVDLSPLNRIIEHTPEDMTVTVEAGLTLAALQSALSRHRQWVPIDPPHAERITIRDLIDLNLSGPRRHGGGTVRDHLIGLRVALPDGRIVHSGGKVVKNVAGYDLMKLFVGAGGSLGVIVEAAFKLQPLPQVEQFVQAYCDSLEQAERLMDVALESPVNPVVLDLHRLDVFGPGPAAHLVLGFAGTAEEVAWQMEQVAQWGVQQPATLAYDAAFHGWNQPPPHRVSVLPSRVITTLRELGDVPFVARAGNGVIHYRGGQPRPKPVVPLALTERLKAAFDPNRILPELPL